MTDLNANRTGRVARIKAEGRAADARGERGHVSKLVRENPDLAGYLAAASDALLALAQTEEGSVFFDLNRPLVLITESDEADFGLVARQLRRALDQFQEHADEVTHNLDAALDEAAAATDAQGGESPP